MKCERQEKLKLLKFEEPETREKKFMLTIKHKDK